MGINHTLILTFVFLLGTFVGSFLNVAILRYKTGQGISGRSKCFSCAEVMKWYDLIPILSFLILRGRCRYCKSKISIQYPLVEFFSGVLFALFFIVAENLSVTALEIFIMYLAYYWIVASILVFIFVYDLKHKIIPDGFSVALALLVFFFHLFIVRDVDVFFQSILIALIISLIFASFWFFSRGRWMGLGDAKLVFGLALFLDFPKSISATILAFWIGALVAILLVVWSKFRAFAGKKGNIQLSSGQKTITMKSELPFGPFLILATLLVFFFNINVFSLFL
jgi:leader peptidase (prepilin peptidase)/N-methyltransferase